MNLVSLIIGISIFSTLLYVLLKYIYNTRKAPIKKIEKLVNVYDEIVLFEKGFPWAKKYATLFVMFKKRIASILKHEFDLYRKSGDRSFIKYEYEFERICELDAAM